VNASFPMPGDPHPSLGGVRGRPGGKTVQPSRTLKIKCRGSNTLFATHADLRNAGGRWVLIGAGFFSLEKVT